MPPPSEWDGPIDVQVKGCTYRKRLAIGLQDIDLQSIKYKNTGQYLSNLYASEEPMYAVSLDATEQFPRAGTLQPWDFIKYYIQFGSVKSDEWVRLSPKSRTNEIDDEAKLVPHTIILDTQMAGGDKDSLNNPGDFVFVDFAKPTYNFRIRIDLDTTKSLETVGTWSPFVYDYKVQILGRSILTADNVERYLFT